MYILSDFCQKTSTFKQQKIFDINHWLQQNQQIYILPEYSRQNVITSLLII